MNVKVRKNKVTITIPKGITYTLEDMVGEPPYICNPVCPLKTDGEFGEFCIFDWHEFGVAKFKRVHPLTGKKYIFKETVICPGKGCPVENTEK